MFLLAEIEVDGFIRQPKFFKDYRGFPEDKSWIRRK